MRLDSWSSWFLWFPWLPLARPGPPSNSSSRFAQVPPVLLGPLGPSGSPNRHWFPLVHLVPPVPSVPTHRHRHRHIGRLFVCQKAHSPNSRTKPSRGVCCWHMSLRAFAAAPGARWVDVFDSVVSGVVELGVVPVNLNFARAHPDPSTCWFSEIRPAADLDHPTVWYTKSPDGGKLDCSSALGRLPAQKMTPTLSQTALVNVMFLSLPRLRYYVQKEQTCPATRFVPPRLAKTQGRPNMRRSPWFSEEIAPKAPLLQGSSLRSHSCSIRFQGEGGGHRQKPLSFVRTHDGAQ